MKYGLPDAAALPLRRSFRIGLLAAVVICIVFLPPVTADTFAVTKEEDDNGPCQIDDCSLREAIIASNASPDSDTILISGGRYILTIPGADESQSMTGDLNVVEDVEIIGDETSPVIIDAAGIDRVLTICGDSRTTVSIANVTITGGFVVGLGGGIGAGCHSEVTITNSTITGNRAYSYDGGGIAALAGNVVLINCTVSRNRAGGIAGGIYRNGGPFGADMTLINSTISENFAAIGAGIVNEGGGRLILTNSTIAGNTAAYWGTGIWSLWTRFPPELTNTIIVGDCRVREAWEPRSYGGNIESPGATCHLTHPSDQMNVLNPGLRGLADNDGPTMTHALLAGSPAIDAGTDAGCTPTDQRGIARPVDGDWDSVARCDAGAFELVPRQGVTEVPALNTAGVVGLAVLLAGSAVFLLLSGTERSRLARIFRRGHDVPGAFGQPAGDHSGEEGVADHHRPQG